MPEPVIYIRGGLRSPGDLASTADPGIMAHLKAVSTLSADETKALHERLSQTKGFLDPRALAAEVRRTVKVEETALSVLTTLQNLGPEDTKGLVEGLAVRGEKEKDFPLGKTELTRLSEILPVLIQPYPALARLRKAERLAKLTGQELESIELICDLRPIFDEERKQIEGMMPYTRLHIVATGEDGLPKSFEAELTHRQVDDLREKAVKANAKLEVLRKSVEGWCPGGLPEVPLTRAPGKKASDA